MEHLYLWPSNPAASLFVLFLFSQVFFYAARAPMHRAFSSAGRVLGGALRLLSRWCKGLSISVASRDREMVLEMGRDDAEARTAREFRRIEATFAKDLARYPDLHRKMDELASRLEGDYKECGTSAPAAPGWAEATAAVAKMPQNGDRVIQKLLEEIHRSAVDGEKKALKEFREVASQRHKILGGMAPLWKELKNLTTETGKSVGSALEATRRIDGYMKSYEDIHKGDAKAVRALGWASTQLFVVSLVVLGVAVGGAFVNFNLIALPMSELVPSGSRIGGMPVSTVAALVVVLMEIAAGIFAMEMLGITNFFPKLALLPSSRRRIILAVSFGGLLLLACIESSLAVLREQIVDSASALKQSLAGISSAKAVAEPAGSRIPVVGQAVLGFILPWILAMVAVPLETLIATGGHIVLSAAAGALSLGGTLARLLAHAARYLVETLRHVYDIFIVLPLQIERMTMGQRPQVEVAAIGPERVRQEARR
ncbi:MAG: hypothetical protein NVS4B10_04800 [Myxococcales bacterium]